MHAIEAFVRELEALNEEPPGTRVVFSFGELYEVAIKNADGIWRDPKNQPLLPHFLAMNQEGKYSYVKESCSLH